MGVVVLPEPADLDGAVLTVRLRDTAMADAPAPLLALVRRQVTQRNARCLDFVLPLDAALPEGARPALEVELLAGDGRALGPGDWLTTKNIAWHGVQGGPVQVPVSRIRGESR